MCEFSKDILFLAAVGAFSIIAFFSIIAYALFAVNSDDLEEALDIEPLKPMDDTTWQ